MGFRASTESDRPYSIQKLNEKFEQGRRADETIFGEMRGGLLLYSGRHNPKDRSGAANSVTNFRVYGHISRDGKGENRLQIVDNHVPRVADVYINEIMSAVPDIIVNPAEGGDIRASRLAEMNQAVWKEHKKKIGKYQMHIYDEAQTFVTVGEVAVKIYWDDEKEWLKEEPVSPFDLVRAPGSKRLEDSPWLIQTSVYTKQEFQEAYGKKLAEQLASQGGGLNEGESQGPKSHMIFKTSEREYSELDAVEVKEFYLRPNKKYPQGYFVFFTENKLLQEGPLPGGIFPIVTTRCLTTPGLPRGHSFIRNIYNLQMEINRATSQDASNMIHFGDDKIVTNSNSSVQLDKKFKGISHLKVSTYNDVKSAVMYLPSAGLPKYMEYIQNLIKKIDYKAHIVSTMEEKKNPRAGDISFVLYSRIKDKRKFALIGTRFEEYQKEKGRTVLALLRHYLNADDIIHSGNRQDTILIDDFKETSDIDYQFDINVGNSTPEEALGKQLQVQQALQYIGPNLNPMQIGLLLRATTLGDSPEIIDSFTANHDSAVQNLILLEKGVMPVITRTEDFAYKAERVAQRMNRPDFQQLPQQIQQLFHQFLQTCEQKLAEQERQKIMADKGLIPTTGYQVTCDFYTTKPGAKGTPVTSKVKVPADALEWLLQAMEKQGSYQNNVENLPMSSQINVGNQISGPQAAPLLQGT